VVVVVMVVAMVMHRPFQPSVRSIYGPSWSHDVLNS
jgi:hypothetical protein